MIELATELDAAIAEVHRGLALPDASHTARLLGHDTAAVAADAAIAEQCPTIALLTKEVGG